MKTRNLSIVSLPDHVDAGSNFEIEPPGWTQRLKEVIGAIGRQTKKLFKSFGRGLAHLFNYIAEANRRSLEIHSRLRRGQDEHLSNHWFHLRGMS